MSAVIENAGRKATLHKGAVEHPCDGCDGKKKWTRRVSADEVDLHFCVNCLRRMDALGGLEECAGCCVKREAA